MADTKLTDTRKEREAKIEAILERWEMNSHEDTFLRPKDKWRLMDDILKLTSDLEQQLVNARDEAIEECAKVAEKYRGEYRFDIAPEIRALKGKGER